jgi:hypothetical protein
MKQETNSDIDLLLKRHGREAGGAPLAESTRLKSAHLDIDELNAFAEKALPAAARARYADHLAECSRCREIASQLSLAAGVIVQEKTAAAEQQSSLKKWLARFFAPQVLRYAVPALAVIAITVLAFTMMRRQPAAEYVAQNEQKTSGAPGAAPEQQPAGDLRSSDTKVDSNSGIHASKTAEVKPENNKAAEQVKTESAAGIKDAKEVSPPPSANQPVAPAPAAQPSAKLTVAENEMQRKVEDLEKRKQEATADQESVREAKKEPFRAKEDNRRTDEISAAGTGSGKGDFTTLRPAKPQTSQTAASRDAGQRARAEEADKDGAAVRSVAGRRFRKERGVWVDTEYDSSRGTVNLARGSEQYRALVADEPAIRTIAEQLNGEVIVVWKGRAYRIR